MRIRNLFLYILCFCFFSFLSIQVASAATVGMTIRKNGALLNEENLYWAYAYDTTAEPSSAASSLIKLQVLTDHGLKDRFRVDKSGNLEASGDIDAHGLCIQGTCKYDWSGMSGAWTIKGDDEIYYDTDNVGIGTSDPNYTLDVRGIVGVNDVQAIYVPDHTDFQYSLILGNGGSNLTHSAGMDGFENTFVGMGAGIDNTTGYRNTFIGALSGGNVTTGNNNTFIGMYSGSITDVGSRNVFIGTQSGTSNTTGSYNVYMGWASGNSNSTGSRNTMLGYGAGYGSLGSDNVFIGHNAGSGETGSNKLYIDNSSTANPLIGGDFSSDQLHLNANVGINDTNPSNKLSVNGGVKIGYSTNCQNGVLRFSSVKGEFEYCYGGSWRGVSSGDIVGDVRDVTWGSGEYSSGNSKCGAINEGCVESYNFGSSSQTCGKKSWGGSAVCDDSKLSVTWTSSRPGLKACGDQNAGCEFAFDSSGNYQSCGLQSSSGSAVCSLNKLSVSWTGDSNGNIECGLVGKGCEKAYDSQNYAKSCGYFTPVSGSAVCTDDTYSVGVTAGTTGNAKCTGMSMHCIEAFDWNGTAKSCAHSHAARGSVICMP